MGADPVFREELVRQTGQLETDNWKLPYGLRTARNVSPGRAPQPFSRAAEKRFRTQPAISSQIRALEEEVGAKLLDRSGGKVSITASGKAFQKYAEEILEARKAVLTAIAEIERVPRGEIIVGANEGTCLHILPEVFAEFKKQYPDVAVNITRADYGKILDRSSTTRSTSASSLCRSPTLA